MKKTIAIILCLFAPGIAWAASARECKVLITDLSQAIDEYKSLSHELSSYDVVLRRDPMQPLVDEEGKVVSPAGFHRGLAVQGIAISNGFKKILVDDTFYSEGDTVGPFQILEIRENGVLAREDGETVFVPLYSENPAPKNPGRSESGPAANPEA